MIYDCARYDLLDGTIVVNVPCAKERLKWVALATRIETP